MTMIHRTLQVLFLLNVCRVRFEAYSLPMFIVTEGRGKCFSVAEPGGTTLRIKYEAPDLVSDKKGGPVWVTANTRASGIGHKRAMHVGQPTSVKIDSKTGEFLHEVLVEGTVDLCVRASAASVKNPMRFSLSVDREDKDTVEKIKQYQQDTNSYHRHLSRMEQETTKCAGYMRQILKEADFAKMREKDFHTQSIHMNAASVWWPTLQLCVLIGTGFTQFLHIVRFFKTRHII